MPQFRSLQLISLTSGLTLEAEADISLVLLISAAWRARGACGRQRFTQSAQEGGDPPETRSAAHLAELTA